MIKRWLRLPLAMLLRYIAARPRLKARLRATMAHSPLLAMLARRVTGQPPQRPPARAAWHSSGAMTARAERICRHLKKARQTLPD